jgi:hypothetical protein
MSAVCPSLLSILAEVPDPRGRRGKRHPLSATLALAVAATLCGYRSYGAIAEWGRHYGPALTAALGFTRPQTPCAAALFLLFRRLDRDALEAALGRWAEAVLATVPPRAGELEPLAIDGKTVRGAQQQGALKVHLLSVLSHRLGLTLAQHAVPDRTNEITAIQTVLEGLLLEGRVVTVDALLCQRAIAQTIAAKGGTTS